VAKLDVPREQNQWPDTARAKSLGWCWSGPEAHYKLDKEGQDRLEIR
jgi:hypothetical protein